MSISSILNFPPAGITDFQGHPRFHLDVSQLKKEKMYLIFPEGRDATFKVITWLRDVLLLDHKDQYAMGKKVINNTSFYSFSFNREHTDLCKKITEFFGLTWGHTSQSALHNGKHYMIPASEQILVIRSKCPEEDKNFTTEEVKFIRGFGLTFSASQLD